MKKNNIVIFVLSVLILLFFRNLFIGNGVSWGDAPYYFNGEFKANMGAMYAWTHEGISFGGPNMLLWLEPYVSLLSGYSSSLGWGSDLALTAFFYLPAIFLACAGSFIFARFIGSKKAYLVSLIYVFNTYFFLLIDGGQVGVLLAYGLFPLSLLGLFNMRLKKPASLVLALVFLQALTLLDPRFSVVAIFCSAMYLVFVNPSSLVAFLPVGIVMVLLNGFWLLPLINAGQNSLSLAVSELNVYSLLNGFSLYQPHWPNNLYGVVQYPGFIFWVLASTIWLFLLQKNKFKHSPLPLMLLVFIFVLKGTAPPLGDVYQYLLNLPFGFALRDSSKFFAPIILISGVLIASFWDNFNKRFYESLVWVVILLCVAPALWRMNFVLSGRTYPENLANIGEIQQKQDDFTRTLWFPQVHLLSFETPNHQSLNAYELANKDVFAINTKGTRDLMNFISEPESVDVLQHLGVNRIVLSHNQRQLDQSEEEVLEWSLMETAINENGKIMPIKSVENYYEITDAMPPVFKAETLYVMADYPKDFNFLENSMGAFLSDGKFDASILSQAPYGSVVIDASNRDIAMNLLKDKLLPVPHGQWAKYPANKRLDWQYQLAVRQMPIKAFDFGLGVSFSEKEGEKIKIAKMGEVLAVRAAFRDEQSRLIINDGETGEVVNNPDSKKFTWYFFEIKNNEVNFVNGGGLVVLNTYGWFSKDELTMAISHADEYINKFSNHKQAQIYEVSYKLVSPVEYQISRSPGNWLMFSDSYHPSWNIDGTSHFAAMGDFNGFLVDDREVELKFEGQDDVFSGVMLSLFGLGVLVVAIIYLWKTKPSD